MSILNKLLDSSDFGSATDLENLCGMKRVCRCRSGFYPGIAVLRLTGGLT